MEGSLQKIFDYRLAPNNIETTVLEYIWLGGTGHDLRSKTMVVPKKLTELEEFPVWNYDGSSTKQATTQSSEIILKPVFKCPDPFRRKNIPNSYLVLCETFLTDKITPAVANFRHVCEKIMLASKEHKPWFGYEQEYILLRTDGTNNPWPLGFPKGGVAQPQGPYYCSVGTKNAIGRAIAEAHLAACLTAGLQISGLNAEVFPGQWEFQIGPAEAMDGPDQLWIARYILYRICEDYGVDLTFEPKPVVGDWNGSGCHTNFSTELTRAEGGLDLIIQKMEAFSLKHEDHLKVYGTDNHKRLTGHHETSSMNKFSHGVANRGTSIRIPSTTAANKCGYIEDRRPAGHADPYLVSGMLVDTFCNEGKLGAELIAEYDKFLELTKE